MQIYLFSVCFPSQTVHSTGADNMGTIFASVAPPIHTTPDTANQEAFCFWKNRGRSGGRGAGRG